MKEQIKSILKEIQKNNTMKNQIKNILKKIQKDKIRIGYSLSRTYGYIKIDSITFITDIESLNNSQQSLLMRINLKESDLMNALYELNQIRRKLPFKFYEKGKLLPEE